MNKPLRLLHIEDSEDDSELLLLRLRDAGYEVSYERVQTAHEMARALQENPNRDIILSDYKLPTFSAPLALTTLKQSGLDIPFIIVSGTIGEEKAVSTMREGARDFIIKDDLTRLIPVIERELRETELRRLKRKVEQAYKLSEQRYRMIVNTAREGIWLFNETNKTTFVNKYLAGLLGRHEQEILGCEFHEFVPAQFRQEAAEFFNGVKRSEVEQGQGDFLLVRADGSTVDVTASVSSMTLGIAGFEGWLVIVTDITDRKKTERERIELLEDLKDAVKIRDEFLSIASHELKTPLTSLKLQTQMRQRAVHRGDESAFTLEKLKFMFNGDARHIDRLTRLIDDMLDISRISTGKLAVRYECFDLCELTQEVIEKHKGQFEAAGCEVTLKSCSPAVGSWDRFRIEQVLTNLLTNAVRYGAGKPVTVELKQGNNNQIQLSVTDSGVGVAKENQERIFHRFERAISANEISGLGLGLYIVKQIVDAHGGQIWVESEIGEGAKFILVLPMESKPIGEMHA